MAVISTTTKKVMEIQPLLNSKKVTVNNFRLLPGRIKLMFAPSNNSNSNAGSGFYWR